MDLQEESASESTGGMVTCEVLLVKSARLQQHHGQSVPDDQHGGRARSWSEIQWARFLAYPNIKNDIARPRESGIHCAGNGDFSDVKPRQSRQDVDEFIGFSAIAKGEDNIPIS